MKLSKNNWVTALLKARPVSLVIHANQAALCKEPIFESYFSSAWKQLRNKLPKGNKVNE